MLRTGTVIIVGLLGVLICPGRAQAEQVTLAPAIQASAIDANPRDGVFEAYVPSLGFGVDTVSERRYAAEFSLAGMPAGAAITGATLTFRIRGWLGPRTIELHGDQGTGTVPLEGFWADHLIERLLLPWPRCFPPSIPCYPAAGTVDMDVTVLLRTLVMGPARFVRFSLRECCFPPDILVESIQLSVEFTPPAPVTLYALTADHRLITFDSAAPATLLRTVPLSGLPAGEVLSDLDVRPLTGELIALGRNLRLYAIDRLTGAVTVGTPALPPLLEGALAIDIEPTNDLVRVVSDTGQQLHMIPDAGAATIDTPFDASMRATSVAYDNSLSGTVETTLYALAAETDRLFRLGGVGGRPSPNGGASAVVGGLGIDATAIGGFDIAALSHRAYAALTVAGIEGLYVIDLHTGGAGLVGSIGSGTEGLRGLTAAPVLVYTQAEGATGAFFDSDLLLANPNPEPVTLSMMWLRGNAAPVVESVTVLAVSRRTLPVDEIVGLEQRAVGLQITSPQGLPVMAERTMRWGPTGHGAHTEKVSNGAALNWYFAEGAQGAFDTYLLLTNPASSDAQATITFLMDEGPPVIRTYALPPLARVTVYAGAIPELAHRAFGVHVSFNTPGTAERAMYFGSPLFNGGHASAGAISPSASWFFAEGATGSFFTTFLLLTNPLTVASSVTVTYFSDAGLPVVRTHTLAPRRRLSLNVATEDPILGNATVMIEVRASSPIVAERSQYWPGAPDAWQGGHNSGGVAQLATKWGLAEGRVGGPARHQTYLLIGNPGTHDTHVTIDFLRTSGAVVTKAFVVRSRSRLTIAVGPGTLVPELTDEAFGAIVRSDQGIVVERAMYGDAAGVVWASGSAAAAARLP